MPDDYLGRRHDRARDCRGDFTRAAEAAGLILRDPPIPDGMLHRVDVVGDRSGRKSGAYVLHPDFPANALIINHKTGARVQWRDESSARPSIERSRQLAAEIARNERERAEWRASIHAAAADKAERIWRFARPVTVHPYLAVKRISGEDVRVARDGSLVIPMRDADGRLWNIQMIRADGRKLYLTGGRTDGVFQVLGEITAATPGIVAEGYATARTLREATGLPVLVAFSAGNLEPIACYARASRPVIVAGDDDRFLVERGLPNTGREAAEKAAAAVSGIAVFPKFRAGDRGTDWNDLAVSSGIEAVRDQLAGVLQAAQIAQAEVQPVEAEAAPLEQTCRMRLRC
jgi:putative DNA primase/helicase